MIIKISGGLLCVLTLLLPITSVLAEGVDAMNERSWYLGAGLGITELDPDTNNTGYIVSDERDSGFKLFGGYDFNEFFTIEGFYADMGSAQVSSPYASQPDGTIDYSTMGVSALWYFWRNGDNRGEDLRKGLQAYLQAGFSFMSNSSSVTYSQDNSTQVQYGAALEYGLNNGVALRAGIDLYDKDAGMVFVGVLKRFGIKPAGRIKPEPAPAPEPVVTVVAEPEPVQSITVMLPEVTVSYDIDSDNDGVFDRMDECPDSPEGISVDTKGCSVIALEFGGVNFAPESYELSEESKLVLDEAAITINASPEIRKIEVQAHTDYKGSGEDNMKLSGQRASSVRDYLIYRGVNEKRLVAKGYGESQPIADNRTEEGRAKNRRVELKVITDEPAELTPGVLSPERTEPEVSP